MRHNHSTQTTSNHHNYRRCKLLHRRSGTTFTAGEAISANPTLWNWQCSRWGNRFSQRPKLFLWAVLAWLFMGVGISLYAEDSDDSRLLRLDASVVIGAQENIEELPGSGAFLETPDLRLQSYDDISRILRKVPGVYLREEDGFGLFPNISLRGVDTTRSGKVTLMEDGVLTAPAPYAAPAAYYSPTAGRMSGIEVLKGSSQIKYGPHTTGGVVNYLSTPIPQEREGYVKFMYGTDAAVRGHATCGDTLETDAGRVGFLLELWARETDGFKEIDSAPDFHDSDDTGFTNIEPMLKLAWEPNSDMYQRLEFKIGYTDREADETYLGLSEDDFDDDPFRRYAASRFDLISMYATRTYLRHYMEPLDSLSLTTTGYYQRFHRNWYKLHEIRDIDTNDNGVPEGAGPMGERVGTSLSAALAGSVAGQGLDVLKGQRAGVLRVRANNRDYYLWGIESIAKLRLDTGDITHDVETGIRYHTDRIRRFQWNDDYTQATNGTITDLEAEVGGKGAAGDRRQETNAIALFIRDDIKIGNLTLSPGIRYEHLHLDHERIDGNKTGDARQGTADLDVYAPGIGVNCKVNEQLTLFGGVYRGISVPGPRAHIATDLDEETSTSYELGGRFQTTGIYADLTFFYTDFNDLIVLDNIGGAGTGESDNAGDVISYGVELKLEYDPAVANDWGFKNPYFLAFTYTNAELDGNSQSGDAESIFAGGMDGNDVPYLPDYQLSAGARLDFGKWGVDVIGTYVDETYTTASNTDDQVNVDGDPDARFGKTDSYFGVDVAVWCNLTDHAKITGTVRNLFDEEYIVSRHPHGPRPGRGRSALVGVEVDF